MRLLCISHPCVAPPNQELFAQVAAVTGWDVSVALPRRWQSEYGERRAERWPSFRGKVIPLPVVGSGNIPLHVYAASLRRLVRRLDPDVVYAHHEPYGLATFQASLAARGIPFGFYSAQNLVKQNPWPFPALERSVLRRAAFATPVSQAVLDVLRAKGYAGPAEVLPLWVDTALFGGSGDRGESPVIGYVGRLAPEKGVDTLIDAVRLLPSDVHVVIAGNGPEEQRLRERAAALGIGGRIDWRGFVDHARVHEVYRELDVLVVPSRAVPTWTEQFGRVVIEGLACGVPVVAASTGELPELLGATGGGELVPEGDAAALARAVTRVLDDPSSLGVAAAQARVRETYGVAAVAERFARLVERVLAVSPRTGPPRLAERSA